MSICIGIVTFELTSDADCLLSSELSRRLALTGVLCLRGDPRLLSRGCFKAGSSSLSLAASADMQPWNRRRWWISLNRTQKNIYSCFCSNFKIQYYVYCVIVCVQCPYYTAHISFSTEIRIRGDQESVVSGNAIGRISMEENLFTDRRSKQTTIS